MSKMMLYAWVATGHNAESYYVMARSEQDAKAAIAAEIEAAGSLYPLPWKTNFHSYSAVGPGTVLCFSD
jgi:hypothetical protein